MSVEAGVSPSESAAKVAAAIANVVGVDVAEVSMSDSRAKFSSDDPGSLNRFREQLRARRVRSAARAALYRGKAGASATLLLNRQAAAVGVVAVCGEPEESPLGPIVVRIGSEKLDEVIEWLTSQEPR